MILNVIEDLGNSTGSASDIGCGTGRFLPALSKSFHKVFAIDISPRLIRRARSANPGLENIIYLRKDLAAPGKKLPRVKFALSVNAFLDPSISRRNRMLDNVCGHISAGGNFLLVVPSVESKILTDQMAIEWNIRNGLQGSAVLRSGADRKNGFLISGLQQGNVLIDGVSTKHYLKEELQFILGKRGLTIKLIEKIEYPWNVEFSEPPAWMGEPYPWDWLVLARKQSASHPR